MNNTIASPLTLMTPIDYVDLEYTFCNEDKMERIFNSPETVALMERRLMLDPKVQFLVKTTVHKECLK